MDPQSDEFWQLLPYVLAPAFFGFGLLAAAAAVFYGSFKHAAREQASTGGTVAGVLAGGCLATVGVVLLIISLGLGWCASASRGI